MPLTKLEQHRVDELEKEAQYLLSVAMDYDAKAAEARWRAEEKTKMAQYIRKFGKE